MKRYVLLFFLLFCTGSAGLAQSFSLSCGPDLLSNGAEVYQSGRSDTLQLITWLTIKNLSTATKEVMLRKDEIALLPGATASICWAGNCYDPAVTVSASPLSILPGDSSSGCFGHFAPNGCRGTSVVRWTFFSRSDPGDSLSITVHYSTYPTAADNRPDPEFGFSCSGRVRAGNRILFSYSLPPGRQGRAELRTMSGTRVTETAPFFLSGNAAVGTVGLPDGIYFCSLLLDGKPVITKKIPVYH
jgi:hypothetical protein